MLLPLLLTLQKRRLSTCRGRFALETDRNPPPYPQPVRALVSQPRRLPRRHGIVRLCPPLGALAGGPRHRRETAAGQIRSRLRQAKQNRCRRRGGPARSAACLRYRARADQIGLAAGPAGSAPHPIAVDGDAHQPHQCPERFLPGVRPGDSARFPHRRRSDGPATRRSPQRHP